jgi:hypothetical protein
MDKLLKTMEAIEALTTARRRLDHTITKLRAKLEIENSHELLMQLNRVSIKRNNVDLQLLRLLMLKRDQCVLNTDDGANSTCKVLPFKLAA